MTTFDLHSTPVILRVLVCLVVVLCMMSCTHSSQEIPDNTTGTRFEQARWLIGSWSSNAPGANNYEVWNELNDTTLVGRSFSIQGEDTVLSESIRLVQSGNELAYIPTVTGQNRGLPVKFQLTFINNDKMIFENPEHEFPQRIAYTHVSVDSMVAEISGFSRGERRAVRFPMRRSD